jgi:hypothetical protein
MGAGSPEQVSIGLGVSLSNGTLTANGLDHIGFPAISDFAADAELVICNQGTPMLMQASLLRGLFSAGQNVAIAADGTISASAASTTLAVGGGVGDLQVVNALSGQDLVTVSHAGSNFAISYTDFLGGITIDQAQAAGSVSDSDTIWAAQGSNVMASQNFGAIWVWIATKLPTYRTPVLEITTSTNLDSTIHNKRILVCTQPRAVQRSLLLTEYWRPARRRREESCQQHGWWGSVREDLRGYGTATQPSGGCRATVRPLDRLAQRDPGPAPGRR